MTASFSYPAHARVMRLDDQEAEIQQSELDLDEGASSLDRSRRMQALDAVNDRWGGEEWQR